MKTNRTRFVNRLLQGIVGADALQHRRRATRPRRGRHTQRWRSHPLAWDPTASSKASRRRIRTRVRRNLPKVLPPAPPSSFALPTEFRTVDGSANNQANSAGAPRTNRSCRLAPNAYADGL